MTIQLKSTCPHCGAAVRATELLIGKRVRCPACKRSFDLTSVEHTLASASLEQARPATETMEAVSADTTDGQSVGKRKTQSPAPKTLGRFELKELLGQGAFGRVFKSYDPQLDRYVALKVPTFGPEDSQKIQRFVAEAKAAARLRHPNIVPTYESGQVEGQYFIATQFVAGQTLSKRVKESQPDFRQAAQWVRQLADALAYAHSEGIVHRDIKPENVMLDGKGVPQIMDFGLAKRLNEDAAMTTDGSILGTPAYMAPEQARGKTAKVGPHSDQYSLGVVLYELLTGKKPFEGAPHAVIASVIAHEPPAPRSIRAEIPRDLEAICQKAMSKEAEQRYPSAAALAADLAHWLAGEVVVARPLHSWERLARWAKRNPAVAGLTAAVISTASVALIVISIALWSAIGAGNRSRIALRNEQVLRQKAAFLAGNLERQRQELAGSLENLKAEQARTEAERKAREKANQDLAKTNEELKAEATKAKLAAEAAERAIQEREKQTLVAKEADKKATEAGLRSTELTRENSMRQIESRWNQANAFLAVGKYSAGLNHLARALKELPDMAREDSIAWNEVLRMAIAVEQASQPGVLSREDRARDIAAFWQIDPPFVEGTGTVRGDEKRRFPRVIDSELNVDDEGRKLAGLGAVPIACVPLPLNYRAWFRHTASSAMPFVVTSARSVGGGYLVVYRDRPAQLMTNSEVDSKTTGPFRLLPFAGPTTVVRAFARTVQALPQANSTSGLNLPEELLVTVLDVGGKSSIRVDRWEPQATTTLETKPQNIGNNSKFARAEIPTGFATTEYSYKNLQNDMPLPEQVRKACMGAVPYHVITASDQRICLWDLKTKSKLSETPLNDPVVDLALWASRGALFVAAGKFVRAFSYPELKPLHLYEHGEAIAAATTSPTGQSLVLSDQSQHLTLLDSASLTRLSYPAEYRTAFRAGVFRRSGQFAVIGGKTLRHWHLPLGEELVPARGDVVAIHPDRSPNKAARATIPDSGQWAVMSHGTHVSAWVTARTPGAESLSNMNPENMREFELPAAATAIACHPVDPILAVAAGNSISIYRVGAEGQPTRWKLEWSSRPEKESARFTSLALGAGASFLLSGDEGGRIRLWDLKSQRAGSTWEMAGGAVTALAIGNGGRTFCAASGDGAVIHHVRARDRGEGRMFAGPTQVTAVALSPSGKELLLGCQDGSVVIFNVDSGERVGRPVRLASAVTALRFQADGKFAVAAGGEGVQLIHAGSGLPAGKFMRSIRETTNAAFGASGKNAFLGGRLYELPAPVSGTADEVVKGVEMRVGAQLDNEGNLSWLEDR